jgi:MarR family transcriptional regulator, organic hydroperoxide resistance regulator
MKPEDTLDYNIKVAWHAIARMYGQQAARVDMTTSIGFVLLNIDPDAGTPTTKIAPLMGLEARSLTRLLKSMESKGLIYRQPDPHDRRSVRICMTPLGLERRETSRLTVRHFNHVAQDRIAPNDLITFFNVIRSITEMIEKKEVYPPDYDPIKGGR